jgi:hypothetical protein
MEDKDYKFRAKQRTELQGIFIKAKEQGKDELAQEVLEKLESEYKASFDELPFLPEYVSNLRDIYSVENEAKYKGTDKELVKQSFDFFNELEQNTARTGYLLSTDSLFDGYSPEQLEKLSDVYEQYIDTDVTGEGSRPFSDQAYNMITNTLSDVTTYATGGIGAIATKGAVKLLLREGVKKAIRAKLAVTMGVASAGAVEGIGADIVQQNLEIEAGVKDEYNPLRTAVSGAIGAVLPSAVSSAGGVVKKELDKVPFVRKISGVVNPASIGTGFRNVMHPTIAIGKETETGAKAAMLYGQDQLVDYITTKGMSTSSGSQRLARDVDDLLGRTNKNISAGFEAIEYTAIPYYKVSSVIDKMENKGLKVTNDMKVILNEIKPYKTSLFGNKTTQSTPTPVGIKELRAEVFGLSKKLSFDGKSRQAHQMRSIYFDLRKIQKDHAKDKGRFESLFNAKKKLTSLMEVTQTGKTFGKIVDATDIDDKAEITSQIIKKMSDGSMSFSNVSKFKRSLDNLDKISVAAGGGSRNSFGEVLSSIQEGMGELLIGKEGMKPLANLLDSTDGFRVLGVIYPGMKKELENLSLLERQITKGFMGKKKAEGGSVILNMTVARISADSGGKVAGKLGSMFAPIIAITGLDHIKSLLNNPGFRKAMADTIVNEGRVLTKTAKFLKNKMKFDDIQIREFQDQVYGLMISQPLQPVETSRSIEQKIQ